MSERLPGIFTYGGVIQFARGKEMNRLSRAGRNAEMPFAETGCGPARTLHVRDHGDVLCQERQHPAGRDTGWVRAVNPFAFSLLSITKNFEVLLIVNFL